jgi:hypothetical protein
MRPLCLLIALWAIATIAFAQNPIAAIHFDSNFTEQVSGNQADTAGLFYHFVAGPSGVQGTAIEIDNGSVVFSSAVFAVMDSLDHSIAFWARKDGSSLWPAKYIFSGPGYQFRYNGVFHVLEFHFRPDPDTAAMLSSVSMPDNQWNHYVISIDRDDSLRFYLDGRLIASRHIAAFKQQRILATNPSVTLGRKDVSLDEVLFFDKALTAAEVQQIYRSALTTVDNPKAKTIVVAPNPARDKIFVERPEEGLFYVSIMDITGKNLRSFLLEEAFFDVNDLALGAYIVRFNSQTGQVYQTRFIKQ